MTEDPHIPEYAEPFWHELSQRGRTAILQLPLLLTMTRDDLREIPNIGRKTINELSECFDLYRVPNRLDYKPPFEPYVPPPLPPRSFEIFAKYKTGKSQKELAAEYGISYGRVNQIVRCTERLLQEQGAL
jgi:hypothetical protein